MEKKTKVILGEYKGHPMFSVWEVDETGKQVGSFPIVNIGKKKAEAIVKHFEDLKEFVAKIGKGFS